MTMQMPHLRFKLPAKFHVYSTGLLLTLFLCSSCVVKKNQTDNSALMIGIAEVNYTPEVGIALAGNYRGNDYASRGVHDSLYARAIVAQGSNGVKVALITVDICNLNKAAVDLMRGAIASGSDIKPENIMISATHTHSGPISDVNAPKAKEYLDRKSVV